MAAEWSGSRAASRQRLPTTSAKGSIPLPSSRSRSPLRTMSMGTQAHSASLASSEGWTALPKRYRRDPLTVFIPGRSSTAMSTSASSIPGHARRRYHSASTRDRMSSSSPPASAPCACLTT